MHPSALPVIEDLRSRNSDFRMMHETMLDDAQETGSNLALIITTSRLCTTKRHLYSVDQYSSVETTVRDYEYVLPLSIGHFGQSYTGAWF